jgi:hypothetical protein
MFSPGTLQPLTAVVGPFEKSRPNGLTSEFSAARRRRATGVAGAIVGPVVAAHFVTLDWSSQSLFLAAAVPASFSCIVVIGLAIVMRRK